MGFFEVAGISSSGMSAEQVRMDIIANNIANSETTQTPEGGPYKRKSVILQQIGSSPFKSMFSNMLGGGVRAGNIVTDNSSPRMIFDPNHPDANVNGYVSYPNIDIAKEMVDMISSSRAYEANITMFNLSKSLALRALEIGA